MNGKYTQKLLFVRKRKLCDLIPYPDSCFLLSHFFFLFSSFCFRFLFLLPFSLFQLPFLFSSSQFKWNGKGRKIEEEKIELRAKLRCQISYSFIPTSFTVIFLLSSNFRTWKERCKGVFFFPSYSLDDNH